MQAAQEGALAPETKHRFEVLVDAPASCPVDTVAYITLLFALNVENVIVPSAVILPKPVAFPVVPISQSEVLMATVSPLSPRVTTPLAVNVPETVRLDEAVVASERVMALDPESITIFPVVEPPRVKVPMLRDWITPSPPIDIPGLLAAPTADTEAVGVPEFIFNTANSALAVAVAPIKKSLVAFDG